MIDRIGFACVTHALGLSTNHTLRLANISPDRVRRTANRNLDDLEAILRWMDGNGLRLFRIGSSLVPFASHESLTWDWEPSVAKRLGRIGRMYGPKGFRFSLHPGQYNVLNSINPDVVRRTRDELEYSCRVLDLMELDSSHKVILHGGSKARGSDAALTRLVQSLESLPESIRSRLALENDERNFNLQQINTVCAQAGVSPVFDIHHHRINPCPDIASELIRADGLWDCRPKVHISSPRDESRPAAHSDFIRKEDLDELVGLLPFDADLMVEAKAKEQAALQVAQRLFPGEQQ
ncbi:MAG: UV DNA damage repair endonuclease UvsE [Desulfovibrionales bacterium]